MLQQFLKVCLLLGGPWDCSHTVADFPSHAEIRTMFSKHTSLLFQKLLSHLSCQEISHSTTTGFGSDVNAVDQPNYCVFLSSAAHNDKTEENFKDNCIFFRRLLADGIFKCYFIPDYVIYQLLKYYFAYSTSSL